MNWQNWHLRDARMGDNPTLTGLLLKDLKMPDFQNYAVEVPKPGVISAEATRVKFLREVMKLNMERRNFRILVQTKRLQTAWVICLRRLIAPG